MSRIVLILIICLLHFSPTARSESGDLESLNSFESLIDDADQREGFEIFLKSLEKKRDRTDDRYFLRHLFYKVHKKFLKHYRQYASVNETFKNGAYDCVSGSVLYAYALEYFGFEYYANESAFHVNLHVKLNDGDVVFEATNPLSGFLTSSKEILNLEQQINLENESQGFDNRQIGFNELIGLQHLNLSIHLFNTGRYIEAAKAIGIAYHYYPSDRIRDMAMLINSQRSDRRIAVVNGDD
ncbi:MAG: hypothetical protein RJQ09_08040 [Cyclobacteriaceae bacterium]